MSQMGDFTQRIGETAILRAFCVFVVPMGIHLCKELFLGVSPGNSSFFHSNPNCFRKPSATRGLISARGMARPVWASREVTPLSVRPQGTMAP